MDSLYELLAKGGIAVAVGVLVAKWLAAALKLLFTKFDERMQAQSRRCEEENRKLGERVDILHDRQHNDAKEREAAFREILAITARALEKLGDNETDRFKALNHGKAKP